MVRGPLGCEFSLDFLGELLRLSEECVSSATSQAIDVNLRYYGWRVALAPRIVP